MLHDQAEGYQKDWEKQARARVRWVLKQIRRMIKENLQSATARVRKMISNVGGARPGELAAGRLHTSS